LNRVAEILKEVPSLHVEIQGHTDNVGPEDSNKKISEWRAGEVREYLIHKGVDEKRLTKVGYGSSRPVADNETEEGRKQNRRINFLVQEASI
jgi:outer membrane protein OmpA-like peptidoglycan-associated protein